VEYPFASIEDRYGLQWAKAKTKGRNKASFVMPSIGWNIERGITWSKNSRLLPLQEPPDGWSMPENGWTAVNRPFGRFKAAIIGQKRHYLKERYFKNRNFRKSRVIQSPLKIFSPSILEIHIYIIYSGIYFGTLITLTNRILIMEYI